MSKQNNILDLSKLEKVKHKELVELAYNLPFGIRADYFYSFMVFMLKNDDLLRYLPRRIKNKANKYIAEYEERKAQKEQAKAEEKPIISEEQRNANSIACRMIESIIDFTNNDNIADDKKVEILNYISIIWKNVEKDTVCESEV